MIKYYFDYKRKENGNLLSSSRISEEEKKRNLEEYNLFLGRCFQNGKVVLNKEICADMMRLIKDKKISLVMDKYDSEISVDVDMPNSSSYGENPFKDIQDIVAVHKTPIPPQDDLVVTQENSGVTNSMVFVDPSTGKQHVVYYVVGNDTIHFTLNCAVENHDVGNDWNSYKYAVMVGLDKLDKEKILDVKSEDTYVDGDAELGDDYFLFCPLGEREKVEKENPNAIVIEYDGISLNQAISSMIVYSGRKLEPYGTYGWGRDFEFSSPIGDNNILDVLLTERGYPNLRGEFGSLLHSETKYMARRMWKREYEALINLIEYNKKNNIDMPDEILNMVLKFGGAYSLPGTVPVSIETYKEYVLPILDGHGYNTESLFDGIESEASGVKYIYAYPSEEFGCMVPNIECPEWESELRSRVISIVKEKSSEYSDGNSPKVSAI